MLFTEHLALERIAPSIGSVGDAYDNALMESIIGLCKTECLRPGPFLTGPLRTHQRRRIRHDGLSRLWNNRRLPSTIGHVPPVEHEAKHYRSNAAPAPAALLARERQPSRDAQSTSLIRRVRND